MWKNRKIWITYFLAGKFVLTTLQLTFTRDSQYTQFKLIIVHIYDPLLFHLDSAANLVLNIWSPRQSLPQYSVYIMPKLAFQGLCKIIPSFSISVWVLIQSCRLALHLTFSEISNILFIVTFLCVSSLRCSCYFVGSHFEYFDIF